MAVREDRNFFLNHRVPIDEDPEDLTMDKKLIINVAPTGAFIKRYQNPRQPYSPAEIAAEVIAAYQEGASVWHVHIRDEEGVPDNSPETVLRALDMVLEKCPDISFSHTSHVDNTRKGAAGLQPLVDPLIAAGKKRGCRYIHSVVIAPYPRGYDMDEAILKDMITYLEQNDVAPEFQIHNYSCISHVRDWLLKDGTLKGTCIMNLVSGFHGNDFSGPTGPEPWGKLYLMSLLKVLPEGCVIGATVGGHSWLPMIVEAMMLGADCVRVGMEDSIWLYPHKSEKISSCAQVVRKIANIARELGREIATPAEARQIMGIKEF